MSETSDQKPAKTPSPIGEISQEPSALDTFLDANQKKLVVIGILAVFILIGYVVYDGLRKISIKDEAATISAAATVPEYEKAIQEVDRQNVKGTALLLKAGLLWDEQQKQEAIAALQDFISSYPEHPAIGSAYAKLGSFQQQSGHLEEATSSFLKAAETNSATSSLALLSLGDIARQAGKNDEAKALYDQIIADYEESHFQVKTLARERLELIGVVAPSEKAPEPPKPENTPAPGTFSAPVGLPDVSPKKPATDTPATDPPVTDVTIPDAPATGEPAPADPETPAPEEPAKTPTPEAVEPTINTPPAE